MTDWAFYATVISTACLVVELVNLGILAYIIRWTGNAGAAIVGKISQSLGLKQGKGSIMNSLQGIVNKVQENTQSEAGEAEPIETPWGTFSIGEIRNLAGQFKQKAAKGEVALPGGRNDMDILGKLASGKNIGWEEAMPLVQQFLSAKPTTENNGGPSQGSQGTAWDS